MTYKASSRVLLFSSVLLEALRLLKMMRQFAPILAFLFCFTLRCGQGKISIFQDPDVFRNVTTLISSKGYPVEEHTVQTADGFILSMQRIPHGLKNHFKSAKKPAVYLQHGLLSAATDWVINYPNQSLGFILADKGYDVWLGNTRGNTYSRRHMRYTPNDKDFWEFSFDQMAQYDLPAMIDHVLNVTGEEKLYYIGHSQGTTAAFAMLSESAKYNQKVKLFVALAPVTSVGYVTSAIRYLAPFANDIDFLLSILGVKEFLPTSTLMKVISEIVCESKEKFICEDIMFLLSGSDQYQLNQTRIAVYSAHTPAGSSVQSVVHYAQMINSKLFTKYNYGKKGNMKHYNQTTPPEYDLSRITAPVALLWGMNDKLADPVDVDILQGKLKSTVSSYLVSFPYFNHQDFVYAMEAPKLVYEKVLSLLTQH